MSEGNLTVGDLKALLARHRIPDDAEVLLESDSFDTEVPFFEVGAAGAKVTVCANGYSTLTILHPER